MLKGLSDLLKEYDDTIIGVKEQNIPNTELILEDLQIQRDELQKEYNELYNLIKEGERLKKIAKKNDEEIRKKLQKS